MTKGRSTAAAARKGVRPAHRWGVYLVAAMLLLLGVTVAVSQLLWAEAAPEPAAASAAPPPTNSAQVSPAPAGADGAQTLNLYGGGMRPLVEERDGVQTLNIYGPGGRIIAQVVQDGQGAETVRYLLTDHLGSTRVVLDAEGNAVARYEYAPHGETTVAGASGAEVQYRYTGHPYDEGQEVYETPNRGYEPTLGRFLSVDPRRQDASPYVYTGNNPVGYLDTTGGGDVPFFMVSNLDLDGAGATRSIAELFGIQPGQKIIDATDFNTIGKRQSFDMQSKAVLDPLDILYPEKEVTYSYNDKLFWLIGDEHGAAMPNQLEPGLRELRTLEPGLAREIVLLDFSTTNRGR